MVIELEFSQLAVDPEVASDRNARFWHWISSIHIKETTVESILMTAKLQECSACCSLVTAFKIRCECLAVPCKRLDHVRLMRSIYLMCQAPENDIKPRIGFYLGIPSPIDMRLNGIDTKITFGRRRPQDTESL